MSSYLLPYTQGTISLENGSKVVAGLGTAFLINVKVGDLLQLADGLMRAVGVAPSSNTAFEMLEEYEGETASGLAYKIHRVSPGWGDASNFNVRFAEMVTTLQTGYAMRSVSPVEIGAGEKEFIVPSGMPILPGIALLFTSAADPLTHWMGGKVTSYDGGQTLVFQAVSFGEEGEGVTRADWNINIAGSPGPAGNDGDDGEDGSDGDDGADGHNGWSPELAGAADGERRVFQVVDWIGGEGAKPPTGKYVGATGYVDSIGDGVDVRGPAGADGEDGEDGAGAGDVVGPAGVTDERIAVYDGATGKLLKDGGYTIAELAGSILTTVRDGVSSAFDTLAEVAAALAGNLPKDGSEAMTGPLVLTEDDAPSAPGSGTVALYAKADHKLYTKDDEGNEQEVGSGGGPGGGREVITASRTYYVRTDGDDGNDGLTDSSGGAFATIQKAIDVAIGLDLSIYDVVIQVGTGTYTAPVFAKSYIGAGPIVIRGDTGTPSNVVISTTSASCFTADGVNGKWEIEGFKLQTTTSGRCIVSSNGSYVVFRSMDFGACAQDHIFCENATVVNIGSNYTISGNAGRHILVGNLGYVRTTALTVTISGTPNFVSQFANANALGIFACYSNTYSGSATGTRYSASNGGLINTNGGGSSYLPGNAAGSATTGQYV